MTTAVLPEVNLDELFSPQGYASQTVKHHARKLVELKVYSEQEQDDVEQELSLRLLRRLQRFESERSSISTYIDRAARYEAMEMFRTRCKPTHVRQRKTRSLDAITVCREGQSRPLTDVVTRDEQVRGHGRSVQDDTEQLDLQHDMADVIESLPSDLRDACRQLLDDRNPLLAIKHLPPATRERLRDHFQAAGMHDYL